MLHEIQFLTGISADSKRINPLPDHCVVSGTQHEISLGTGGSKLLCAENKSIEVTAIGNKKDNHGEQERARKTPKRKGDLSLVLKKYLKF